MIKEVPEFLASFPKLRGLSLGYTNIKDLGKAFYGNEIHLLYLNNNRIKKFPEILKKAKNILYLDITNNDFLFDQF